jgi:hypothetical protein
LSGNYFTSNIAHFVFGIYFTSNIEFDTQHRHREFGVR